jgi:hypothetical protein
MIIWASARRDGFPEGAVQAAGLSTGFSRYLPKVGSKHAVIECFLSFFPGEGKDAWQGEKIHEFLRLRGIFHLCIDL